MKINKYIILKFSVTIFTILAMVNIFFIDYISDNFSLGFSSSWLKPSIHWSLALIVTGIIAMLFKKETFSIWFKKFFLWYFLLAYLFTFTFSTYGGLMTMTRSDASILLGVLMAIITTSWVVYDFITNRKEKKK